MLLEIKYYFQNIILNNLNKSKYQSVEETSPCVYIFRIKDGLSRVSDLLGQLLGDQAVVGLHHHVLHPPLLQSFRSIEIKPSLLPPSPPVDWPLIKSRQKNNSDELQQVAGRLGYLTLARLSDLHLHKLSFPPVSSLIEFATESKFKLAEKSRFTTRYRCSWRQPTMFFLIVNCIWIKGFCPWWLVGYWSLQF